MRKSWNVAPEERVVLLAARLTAWKGQKVLIEAARLLIARGMTDVKFILAGDDQGRTSYMRELDAAIEKAGLRGACAIMVGGAPVTQEYADVCGADGYAADAATAVRKAKELVAARRA